LERADRKIMGAGHSGVISLTFRFKPTRNPRG
jgi:hypothetical protein